MPFGEYELSPSLIGLSLLHSPHPEAFQRLLVRTSIPCYRDFILDKCRSLGFASASTNYSLSVSYEYLALPDGPGGFTQDYSCPALLRSPLRFRLLRVRGCHPLWRGFPVASTHGLSCDGAVLQPRRCRDNVGLGSSPVARHYWGNHSLFSFPAGTKMFQFPAFASRIGGIISLQDIGLSHSEIRGSRAICASPRLFAAYHVLHRL